MPRVELTDRFVSGSKVGDYFDAKTVGLNLRVTPNGVRSWFLIFTSPGGKRARVTLGRYPQTPLSRACALAIEARGHLDEGKDPRERNLSYYKNGSNTEYGAIPESFFWRPQRTRLYFEVARFCLGLLSA